MKTALTSVIGIAIAAGAFAQTAPPYHLNTELSPSGSIELSWEMSPPEGLVENFDDNLAQDFDWWTEVDPISWTDCLRF